MECPRLKSRSREYQFRFLEEDMEKVRPQQTEKDKLT